MSEPTLRVIHGDNVDVMGALAGDGWRFALAYLDAPFFTQRAHAMPDGTRAFDDRWESLDHYLSKLVGAARAAHSLLHHYGSIVVHVDPKTSHYVKVALDDVFGRDAFASEIIWRYRRWPSKTRNFQRVHDVLLRWVKDPKARPQFAQLYEPLSPKTIETWGTRKQRAVWSAARGTAAKESPPRRKRSSATAEQSPGVPMGDVWDISILAPVAKERTGFPTQKPEKLLERLVLSLTEEGDSVLDPYCGSGTTLAVCQRLRRGAVGIDSSPVAVRIASERVARDVFTEARP